MDGQGQNNAPPDADAGQQNQQGQPPIPPQNPIPDLREDPYQAQCPDFTSAFFEDMRNALILSNAAADHEGAVAALVASWVDKNVKDRERWDAQQARQQGQGANPPPGHLPEAQGGGERDPPGSPKKSASKKKLPSIKRGVKPGEIIPDQPAPFAINKLKDLSYCDLWYFTAEARKLTTELQFASNDDALTISRADNSLVFASAARPSKNVKRDEELTYEQMCVGGASMIRWANKLGWPEEHVQILNAFFYKLQYHPLRSEPDGLGTLVLYQARYRRDWHRLMDSETDEAFDLSEINEDALECIRREILDTSMRSMRDGLAQVSDNFKAPFQG